jgi:hypothetical protein
MNARGLVADPAIKSDDGVEGMFALAILSLCHANGVTGIDAICRVSSKITGPAFDAINEELRLSAEAN